MNFNDCLKKSSLRHALSLTKKWVKKRPHRLPDAALYDHSKVMRSVLPMQDAIFCRKSNEGLAFPFSKREMFACLVPIFSANCFWVSPAAFRLAIASRIASYCGAKRSYSSFTSGCSANTSYYNKFGQGSRAASPAFFPSRA